jgi:PAS domain S-box-containing protein
MANSVLLIDKSRSHADALGAFLERQQVQVTIVNTFDDARIRIEKTLPEIVIADPNLPGGEIKHLLKQIKKEQPLTQIIVISEAEALDQTMEEFRYDVATYLSRPVKSRALNFAIKQAKDRITLEKKVGQYEKKIADLRCAQRLYQQLFDEVPCYITVQDQNFRLTATNKKFKEDFGDEIGSHCFEIYKHRTARCEKCPVAATFKDGLPHSTEEIVTSKTGKHVNTITWTAPIRNGTGEIAQVMEISTDITQIRQLQDHLTSLGLMLGSMSHSVKGMLTALDGRIYQLESGLIRDNPERVEQAFNQVKQIAERIKKMVLEILYYAKSRELNCQSVDATQMAQEIIETVKSVAEKNNVCLKVDISPSLGVVDIDHSWVPAAIVNILENAIDACTSDHDKSEHHVIFKVFLLDSERLCYIIEDNGLGMDQETIEKMFTLFFSSKGSMGTGLGLFIAHHVINQHGGTVHVESKPGDGSKFQICLPLHQPTQSHVASAGIKS